MDDDMKQLRVRFTGVGRQEDRSGRATMAIPSQQSTSFGRGLMSNGEEYDAAYAATVAAVAYAIAAREEEKFASQETPAAERFASGNKRRLAEKLRSSQKKPASVDERPTLSKSPTNERGESLTKKPITEGSKISRWLSGKDPVDDDYDDEQGGNVSVRRPLKPAQKKPEGISSADERQTAPTLKSPTKRGESLKRPTEGSKISRWLSGIEPVDDDYDDEQGANVSVRRPLKPAQKKPEGIAASADDRQTAPTLKSPTKRGESLKRPIEGSKISRWLSGKEPVGDDYDYGEQGEGANVSVRRPLKPAQRKPEGMTSGQNVVEKVTDSAPSFTRKPTEKKGSRRFEQDQAHQMAPPAAAPTPNKPMSSSYSGNKGSRVAASGTATSSDAEAMADAWEKEKMAKIKKQYNETMETIAEWEAEKKAKARRERQLKDESDSERKRAKALEEYNDEMSRINKVAAASRLTAEVKRSNAETKVREKADRIRATGKLPSTCGCF